MSNGGIETFVVIDPGFKERMGGIPAHYQMKVEKLGLPKKQDTNQIVYNMGDNAKVYNQSTDKSITINNNQKFEISNKLNELEHEIKKISDEIKKQEALEIFHEIKIQSLSDKPNKTIIKTLIEALPSIDNVASIANSVFSFIKGLS